MTKSCFTLPILITIYLFSAALADIPTGVSPSELKGIFAPLPKVVSNAENHVTPEKVALGKRLFNEKRLSRSQKLSCNSCHGLDTWGVDNEKTSLGHEGQRGTRNSPTVYNAALHFAQFWDGRASDVESQALGPVMNPVEMAMKVESDVTDMLKNDASYPEQFRKAFPGDPDPVSFTNLGKAIGAFERTLLTPSKFDAYLSGDTRALSARELKGLAAFKNTGCIACHNGVVIGGASFQKLGTVLPFATTDQGRYEVTRNEADRFMFKVPSLRNIEKTAPYFHDGSILSLEKAVKIMASHQLGQDLDAQQVGDIVTFLKALTAPLPSL